MIAYTDGACFPNPGKGTWAWCLVKDEKLISDYVSDVFPQTTNNRMEYQALIGVIKEHGPLLKTIFTDSMMLVNTCNLWRYSWKKKNWKKKGKDEIKNLDLVLEIDGLLIKNPQISIEWVRGHNGNKWNEHVDQLANGVVGI